MYSRRDLFRWSAAAAGLQAGRIFGWQDPKPEGGASPDVKFSANVNVVNVLATVHDKQGKVIKNLVQDDFTLEEDGRPQVIRYFSQQSDLPLTLGLLVDTSGSQRNVLEQERRASSKFLEQVLREDRDKAFLIQFDQEVELLQDVTSSRRDLQSALADLGPTKPQLNRRGSQQPGQQPYPYPGGGGGGGQRGGGQRGGGTALYDAVLLASDEVMKKEQGRKAVILLSDGVDNGSKVSLTSAIESAQRADTLVYSIRFYDTNAYGSPGFGGPGLGGGGRRRGGLGGGPFPGGGGGQRYPSSNRTADGKKTLQRLSEETGGSYFEVSSKETIEKIYSQIEDELRSQYNLGYTSDQTGPGYRMIKAGVKLKNLTVQARQGYYAR